MSRCSKKCNELKEKINSISGLNDNFIYVTLCKIEQLIDLIEKYADEDELNGTCFKRSQLTEYKLEPIEKKAIEILSFSELIRGRSPENDAVIILLNLIEKQQEEIKDLKEDLSKKVEELDMAMNNPDYISKDKIKEEIKKLSENNGVAINMHTGQIVKTEEDYKIAILRKLLRSK